MAKEKPKPQPKEAPPSSVILRRQRDATTVQEAYSRLQVRNRVLERLLHLFSDLSQPARVAEEILNAAMDGIPSEAASLLVTDPANGDLVFVATRGPVATKILGLRMRPDEGVAGAAMTERRVLAISDVRKDRRHAAEFDRLFGFETRSLLAVPILHRSDAYGVIELVNKAANDLFPRFDLELAERIARAAGSVIHLLGDRTCLISIPSSASS